MKYLFLLLFISGCGSSINHIDPSFEPIYDQFIVQANVNGLNLDHNQGISIQFGSLEEKTSIGEVVGQCSRLSYGYSQITIDKNFWESSSYDQQFLLLYHELGHCVLYEIHTGKTEAIMNPLLTNPLSYYKTDLNQMVKELFIDKGDGYI